MSNSGAISFDQKLAVGAVAGITGTSIVYPFDVIKTQLQTQTPSLVKDLGLLRVTVSAAKDILATRGLSGLYKGFEVCVFGIAPEKGIKLAVNDYMRDHFSGKRVNGKLTVKEEIIAGSAAGVIQLSVTVPYEHVKIKLQTHPRTAEKAPSALDVIRKLGVSNLYKGFMATFLRDVPFCFVFFPLYSQVKSMQLQYYNIKPGSDEPFHFGLIAGVISGTVAGGLVTPADMIKTRIQKSTSFNSSNTSVIATAKGIIAEGGLFALYSGWHTRVMVIGPLYGFVSLAFEIQKQWLMKM